MSDLSLLIDAARASGAIAQRYWKNSPEVWDKLDGAGPVTEADLEIDRMLSAELRSSRPDYGWLSEETDDDAERLSHEKVFIIDPIDGTRAFIAGERNFSHSLAIAENGRIMTAAVFLPMLDKLYVATSDSHALLNDTPISVSRVAMEKANLLAAKPNFDPQHWPGGVPPVKRHFRSSLAYRLCLVAEGAFDGMLTLRDTWEWDVAAGSLIAARAGATVSDTHGGKPAYNNVRPKLRGMIAAGPDLHSGLRARLPD